MNCNYKNQRSLFIVCLILLHLFINCNPSQESWNEKLSQPGAESALLFLVILPIPDFNRFCPPTEQFPILEPGVHSINFWLWKYSTNNTRKF